MNSLLLEKGKILVSTFHVLLQLNNLWLQQTYHITIKDSIPNAEGLRFGIVVSEWNEKITEGLYKGAQQALIDNGVSPEDIIRVNVPGSFELTFGASMLAETTNVDAIITLGSVIQGETKTLRLCLSRCE